MPEVKIAIQRGFSSIKGLQALPVLVFIRNCINTI